MPVIGSLDFQRKFGEFQHRAQREPVEITRHGCREFVLMSAGHYDWLRAAAQRSHRMADAADMAIDAVERAEMEPDRARPEDLLKRGGYRGASRAGARAVLCARRCV